jgi:hypothetical protein
MAVEILQGIEVSIESSEVLRLQGYRKKGKELTIATQDILNKALSDGLQLIQPRAIYAEVKVKEIGRETVKLENGLALHGRNPARAWKHAHHLAVVACTIGSALEERVSKLFSQGEYPEALMLDSVGSVAVENVANYANYVICQKATGSCRIGPRLSPGYGKWALTDQAVLFAIIPVGRIGVRLNEQYLMQPRKSISFCVGMGKDLVGEGATNPCQHCGMQDCRYRRSA